MRTTSLVVLLSLLGALSGCAAAGTITAGDGQSRTLGQPPDDDDDDSVANDDDVVDDDDDSTPPGDDDDSVPVGDLATGIDITKVTLNQSVQVSLMENEDAPNNLPLVAGRRGLMRIHLEPQSDWEPRNIIAALSWDTGQDDLPALAMQDVLLPLGASEDGVRNSTFEFLVPDEYVVNGAAWSIELLEEDDGSGPGNSDRARWPRDQGMQQFLAYNTGPVRILVVPIQYDADGSGRLPDTSPSQLGILSEWMYRIYPTSEIEIVVDEPFELSYSISPGGNGWGDLLGDMTDLRSERNVPSDTYIYGMFRPTDNAGQFCGGGCVAGLSWRTDSPNDVYGRASIGLGFSGEGAAGTMIHEIGHAHGRAHAPCGLSNPDPNYPHSDGTLGVWGWDPLSDAMRSPTEYRDMMGYCTPRWVSDYTWQALRSRISYVNANFEWVEAPPELPWRLVVVGVDGTPNLRGTIPVMGTPSGDPVPVGLLDASGNVLATVQGRYGAFDHIPGGTLLVPEPADSVVALRVDGEVLPLP